MSATAVLVHGAWTGGWIWEQVLEGLANEGVRATSVDLELQTLDGDAEIVRRAVTDARALAQPVMLVGHSYGGMVISTAGHNADELVYVCAAQPVAGASMVETLMSEALSAYATGVSVLHADGTVTVDPNRAFDALYHRCPASVAAAAIARLRPFAAACMGTPVADPAWLHVQASYVVCTDDRAIPPALQR